MTSCRTFRTKPTKWWSSIPHCMLSTWPTKSYTTLLWPLKYISGISKSSGSSTTSTTFTSRKLFSSKHKNSAKGPSGTNYLPSQRFTTFTRTAAFLWKFTVKWRKKSRRTSKKLKDNSNKGSIQNLVRLQIIMANKVRRIIQSWWGTRPVWKIAR